MIRRRDEEHQRRAIIASDWLNGEKVPKLQPTFRHVADEFAARERQIGDPTTLIVIDEADRLRMASLEQARAIFLSIVYGLPGLRVVSGYATIHPADSL